MKFSIIVVALNPGEKLKKTIDSILCQTYTDYEIVVKDGGSRDGSVETLPKDKGIRIFAKPDTGIYDAMNQAVQEAEGEYILFLNCGDSFYDEKVLERAAACIAGEQAESPLVVYGDTYSIKNDVMLTAPGKIDGFTCYRNIPCHQSCFYEARLCKERAYCTEYRIRADYDHFLWCYYKAGAKMVSMKSAVSSYEGGGYSESRENRKRDKEEHQLITEQYMSGEELKDYRRRMLFTLAPVRRFLGENRLTAWLYHWVKDCLQNHKLRILAGLVVLAAELFLFFGTGVLREDIEDAHIKGSAWQKYVLGEGVRYRQEFIPQYENLSIVGIAVKIGDITQRDGSIKVSIEDENGEVIFEEVRSVAGMNDEIFTDFYVDGTFIPGQPYYMTVAAEPSSAGEYPYIYVCEKDYYLAENGSLEQYGTLDNLQLSTSYQYLDLLLSSKVRNVILICIVTALGIMFGLPDNKYFRKLVGILLLVAGPYMVGARLELMTGALGDGEALLTYRPVYYLPISLKWNVGLMYGIELFILLCTQSARITVLLTNIGLTLLYSVNYFVFLYRGTPLRMNDFAAAGTAVKVLDGYSFIPNSHLAVVWGLTGAIVVFAVQIGKGRLQKQKERRKQRKRRKVVIRLASYVVTISVALTVGGYCFQKLTTTDILEEKYGFIDSECQGFYQDLIYWYDGYLVATCIEIKNSRIVPPDEYSVERVEEILEENGTGEEITEELPHVILVMNESFSDLRVVADLGLNQENMEFFNSLQENTIRGFVNASIVGGGTANTEFEVFTGCSMAFCPAGYYPYQQAIKAPVNSMISQMKKYGYTTYSMHPESAVNWNREYVYQYYGFDYSLWEEDFEGAEWVHRGVSDAATYDKIIELYENRAPGEKMFVFDLTMQNHGGYALETGPDEIMATNYDEDQLNEYLSLVKISDEALEELVNYFAAQEEKVIICMFGDHQPWVTDLLTVSSETESEKALKKYKTPFVIWANYDIEEENGYDISMNYLGGLIQKTAGIPLSPFFTYLEQLRKEYPIIAAKGYVDRDGNYYNWDGTGKEFLDYRMLQYNYLYDKSRVEWGY